MDKKRLYGEVSESHETDFIFIKGVFGCRNNGEGLEKMIEMVLPLARKEVGARKAQSRSI